MSREQIEPRDIELPVPEKTDLEELSRFGRGEGPAPDPGGDSDHAGEAEEPEHPMPAPPPEREAADAAYVEALADQPGGAEESAPLAPEPKRARIEGDQPADIVRDPASTMDILLCHECCKCDLEYEIDDSGGPVKFRTRAVEKALEKEIPWHLIPHADRPEYTKALEKEWSTWQAFGSVVPLSLSES